MAWSMRLDYFTADPAFPFFIQYGQHDEDLPLHNHQDFSELVVVLRGSAIHRVDGESYPVSKGDVFVINGDTEHGYFETDKLQICNIMFQNQLLEGSAADLGRLAGFQALFVVEPFLARQYRFSSRLHLGVAEQEQLETRIRWMAGEYQGGGPGSQTLVRAGFLELVVLLSRWYQELPPSGTGSLIHIARAVAFMEGAYRKDISLEDISAQADLSARHFSRLFKSSYCLSPMQYLQNLRLRQACALLGQTSLSISEVAERCGFADSNHFSRQFHRMVGFSPRDFRRQRRQGQGMSVFPG